METLEEKKTLGTQLKSFRKRVYPTHSLNRVANIIGISPSFLSYLERDMKTPSLTIAQQIADAYNCKVDDLLKKD